MTVLPNQFTQVYDSVTVMPIVASLQHKTSAATFHLCQIALNRKLSHILYAGSRQREKNCVNLISDLNFLSRSTEKSNKKRSSSIIMYSKTDLLSIVYM